MPARINRLCAIAFLALSTLVASVHAKADLIGSTVTAKLQAPDFIDFTLVTPFVSSAVIGSGTEFTGTIDLTSPTWPLEIFNISANFTGTDLTISVASPDGGNIGVAGDAMLLTFSDPAFVNPFRLSNGEPGMWGSYLNNSTLTLEFYTLGNGDVWQLTDVPLVSAPAPSAVTPEPSSFALLGTGLLGMMGLVRRRLA